MMKRLGHSPSVVYKIRLSGEQDEIIRRTAEERKIPVAQVIRKLVDDATIRWSNPPSDPEKFPDEIPQNFVGAIDVPLSSRLEIPKEVGIIETIQRPEVVAGKTCRHGTRKGYNCGLCGGIAVTD